MRPANLVTAAADIFAGYAASGAHRIGGLSLLVGSSVCLYAGGVVLNDIFDAKLDAVERPERPIPSGRISLPTAAGFGASFLVLGTFLAFLVTPISGLLAGLIGLLATIYDWQGKRHDILGPINMAACRGANVMLGVSVLPGALVGRWYLAAIAVLYIGAITLLSRGEVHGGSKRTSLLTLQMVIAVVLGLLLFGRTTNFSWLSALPFVLYFAWRVLPPFAKAYMEPKSQTIRRAVLAGVLSLVVLDSALVAGYDGIFYGGCVLSLSLLAGALARLFAVT